MPGLGWNNRAKRAREASVREQEHILDALLEEGQQTESELRMYREVAASGLPENPVVYPFRFGGDPFPYYRFTPYFFGSNAQHGQHPSAAGSQYQPSQKNVGRPPTALKKGQSQQKLQPQPQARLVGPDGRPSDGYYAPHPYSYYPYPAQYGGQAVYPSQNQNAHPGQYPAAYPYPYGLPVGQMPHQPQGYPAYPPPPEPTPPEDEESAKSGMMSIEGRRPLFLVALFVVSIAVLLISFPLTLLSAGYIGPLGLMFATGPFATVFAFWAIYLTPCECYPNVEWATSRIRVFATTAAVFDAVGTIGVPISMYGAQCPDDDDTMLGCEDELPAAKGISLAVAVVLGTHCFLCLLVRSNARKLAESKFGDERTEGITLTPTPFDRN